MVCSADYALIFLIVLDMNLSCATSLGQEKNPWGRCRLETTRNQLCHVMMRSSLI